MIRPASDRTSLSLTVKECDGEIVRYAEGEIDVSTSAAFSSALCSMAGALAGVILDFSGVTFIDSSGLHALLAAARKLDSRQSRIAIRRPSRAVYRTMEIAGLLGRFDIICE